MKSGNTAESDCQAITRAPMEFTKNPNAARIHTDATTRADTTILVATEGLEAMDCTTAGIAAQWTVTNKLDRVEYTFLLQYAKVVLISPN